MCEEHDGPDRLQRRRERNRLAAQKCREKKRAAAKGLLQQFQELESSNTKLRYEIRQYEKKRNFLEQVLKEHDCQRKASSSHPAPEEAQNIKPSEFSEIKTCDDNRKQEPERQSGNISGFPNVFGKSSHSLNKPGGDITPIHHYKTHPPSVSDTQFTAESNQSLSIFKFLGNQSGTSSVGMYPINPKSRKPTHTVVRPDLMSGASTTTDLEPLVPLQYLHNSGCQDLEPIQLKTEKESRIPFSSYNSKDLNEYGLATSVDPWSRGQNIECNKKDDDCPSCHIPSNDHPLIIDMDHSTRQKFDLQSGTPTPAEQIHLSPPQNRMIDRPSSSINPMISPSGNNTTSAYQYNLESPVQNLQGFLIGEEETRSMLRRLSESTSANDIEGDDISS